MKRKALGRRPVPPFSSTAATMSRVALCLVAIVLCWAPLHAYGIGFPFMHNLGLTYSKGDMVHVLANSVTSHAKIVPLHWRDVIPCTPHASEGTLPPSHLSIGQMLMGETVVDTGIRLKVLEDQQCVLICSASLNGVVRGRYERRILDRYRARLMLDGLPALEASPEDSTSRRIRIGVPLGNFSATESQANITVYNHFHFIVLYYPVTSDESTAVQIVQFGVRPRSVTHIGELGRNGACTLPEVTASQTTQMENIRFSYSVEWIKSDISWKTRWDAYIDGDPREAKVHWYFILSVFLLVLLHSMLLWYVLIRFVRRDILSYNEEDLLGDWEDSGWRLVHGDIFRPPRGAVVLSMLVGSGMQILCMVVASLVFAVAGMISYGSRGMLATLLVMLFVFFSCINGLVTATLIKFFRRRSWHAIAMTSIALPGFLFVTYLALNLIHYGARASSALRFSFLLYLLRLWLCVSVPLCVGGAVAGFKTNISIPVKVNAIPRTIPPQPWYMKSVLSYLAFGVVPLAASYVELQSIFTSVWLGAMYHMFSFLIVAFVLVVIIVAQMSVFSTYFQLLFLNYRWWWRSFWVSASYGVWLMLYCIFYYMFFSVVEGFLGMMLFFVYMGLVCVAVSLMFGAVGFFASFIFVRIVFSNVKLD
ncbi:hypothetical protein JKF63_02832 [Porcisia hertigi]|uniref:Transmembrane 9 superfamily member n=1 Tax=Porcisia hertigi TaxID=2761500 RepID=A0A836L4J6_9TRYP|nr:hypothetical protein JKF63_02832 [Porcisia hertigi]